MIGADTGYAGCCGFREIHSFVGDDEESYPDYAEDDPERLITKILRVAEPGQLFHIWFMNPANFAGVVTPDHYEFNDLRLYVQTLPGVVHLGEHINPNSNNQIDGYMFKKEG